MPSPGKRGKYGDSESKSETPGRAAPFFAPARPVTVVSTPQILLRLGGSCMTSSADIHEKHKLTESIKKETAVNSLVLKGWIYAIDGKHIAELIKISFLEFYFMKNPAIENRENA
jgi:hypothetical protein